MRYGEICEKSAGIGADFCVGAFVAGKLKIEFCFSFNDLGLNTVRDRL